MAPQLPRLAERRAERESICILGRDTSRIKRRPDVPVGVVPHRDFRAARRDEDVTFAVGPASPPVPAEWEAAAARRAWNSRSPSRSAPPARPAGPGGAQVPPQPGSPQFAATSRATRQPRTGRRLHRSARRAEPRGPPVRSPPSRPSRFPATTPHGAGPACASPSARRNPIVGRSCLRRRSCKFKLGISVDSDARLSRIDRSRISER
jgi:hypothetical protein